MKNRRSIRLCGYDYAQAGAYFITFCAQNRLCLFGDIVNAEMQYNDFGIVVADSWEWLASQYSHVELDEWVIMPNHMHGVIVLSDDCRGGSRTALRTSIPVLSLPHPSRIYLPLKRNARP